MHTISRIACVVLAAAAFAAPAAAQDHVWRHGLIKAKADAGIFMMVSTRDFAKKQGLELKINWPGRLGVAPTMGAPFFAMAGVHWLAVIMLYVGLALALLATAMYVRTGLKELSNRNESAKHSTSD